MHQKARRASARGDVSTVPRPAMSRQGMRTIEKPLFIARLCEVFGEHWRGRQHREQPEPRRASPPARSVRAREARDQPDEQREQQTEPHHHGCPQPAPEPRNTGQKERRERHPPRVIDLTAGNVHHVAAALRQGGGVLAQAGARRRHLTSRNEQHQRRQHLQQDERNTPAPVEPARERCPQHGDRLPCEASRRAAFLTGRNFPLGVRATVHPARFDVSRSGFALVLVLGLAS